MKKAISLIGAAALIGIFCFLYWTRREEALQRMRPSEKRIQPISVSTITVRQGPIEEYVYATGTIRAVKREYCYFETAGKVTFVKKVIDKDGNERDIREGDRVVKGELLATVETSTLEQEIKVQEASLKEASAALDKAEVDFRRYKTLHEKNAASKTEFEQYELARVKAEASVKTVEAKLKQSEIALEHAKIYAPCDGVVAYMNVKLGYYFGTSPGGNSANESELLKSIPFIILHDNEMELSAGIPAAFMDMLRPEQDVIVFRPVIDSSSSKIEKIAAKVYSVNPAVDPGGRSVEVKIRARVNEGILKDGQYVSCWIITRKAEDALIIPYNVILFQDNLPYCFVVKGDTAEQRELLLGIEGNENVQVLKGLSKGEQVVFDGNHRLVNGTLVKVVRQENMDDKSGTPSK